MATANPFDLLGSSEAFHKNFSPPCSIREGGEKCCTITRSGWPCGNRGWKRWSRWRDGRNRYFGNGTANGISRGYGGGGGNGDRLLERESPPRQPFGGGHVVDMGSSDGNGNEDSGGDSERSSRRLYQWRSGTS